MGRVRASATTMSGVSAPPPADPRPGDGMLSPDGVLAAVPRRLRPWVALVLGNRLGGLLLHTGSELIRVQIFDRSMTLAAQAFTSVFPLLIMLAALSGERARSWLLDQLGIPDSNARLLQEALTGSRSNAFGVVSALIVVLSATGLARALRRAYRVVWSVRDSAGGVSATGRQVAGVLLLVAFVVGTRLLGGLASRLPAPWAAGAATVALAGCAIAIGLPRILLGPVVSRGLLLASGAVFAVLLVGVRAAGSVYLPRALQASADRYGTFGLAFTYIGWLYVLSFCLLLSAVLGRVLTAAHSGGVKCSSDPR